MKNSFVWLCAIIAIVSMYQFRYELGMPTSPMSLSIGHTEPVVVSSGEVSIGAGRNGHFIATLLVNGTHVDFLVDTGASIVALTEFDALRIGFAKNDLMYNKPIRTANGETMAASVLIDSIKIGDIEIENIEGAVLQEGLDGSLLGMTFLRELSSFTIDQDRLVMRR